MALHDPLTGLPTRRLLLERAREILRLADRRGSRVAVVAWRPLDPATGSTPEEEKGRDRIVVATARSLRKGLRASDLVGRTGEDEFVLVLPGLDTEDGLREALERLSRTGRDRPGSGGPGRKLAHHAGAALYPDHGARVEELLERAREALGRAERNGVDTRIFQRAGDGEGQPPPPDPDALRAAVREGRLTLVYQPVVRISDRRTEGIEALLRIPGEDGVLHEARRILPLLRTHGLAAETDEAVLARAVRSLAARDETDRPDWLAVNLTVETVAAEDFVSRVSDLLAREAVEPRDLVVELAAEDARRNPDGIRTAMGHLREVGIRVALDDVGLGPLPLAPLGERPLHFLKLDRATIRGLHADGSAAALVDGLVGLGHSLGARVVAEGVESEEELRRLDGAGCDLAQGFHLGQPRSSRRGEAEAARDR